jgi:tRNA 2-selenouridine synthase
MRHAECIRVDTAQPLRVELLKDEYAHFVADPTALSLRLARLVELHGRKTIERWAAAAAAGDWNTLIRELLVCHYDPMYARSMARNFPNVADAIAVSPVDVTDHAFRAAAREVESGVNARSGAGTVVAA